METALRLFSERGTTAVSMRELAEAAGVTVPGLYYHFASKAELIREVYRARGHGAGWNPDAGFVPPTAGPVTSIIVFQARQEFGRLVADHEFLRLMHRQAVLGDADALEVGAAMGVAWRERWVEVLQLATDLHPDADLHIAADCIVTFLWGLFVQYLTRLDETMVHGIDDFARLVAPALTRSAD